MGLLDYIKANTPRATTQRVSPSTVISEGLLNTNQFNAPAANRFKDSVLGLAGIVPGVGDFASGVEAADLWNRGEKGYAGLAALGALPLIPAFGGTLKVINKSKRPVKAYHGSTKLGENWFDNEKLGSNSYRYSDTFLGHFASANPKISNEFAGAPLESVYPVSKYGKEAAGLKDYKNIIPKQPVEGGAIYPIAVNLKNPKVMTAAEYRKTFLTDSSPDIDKIKNDLINAGHDGIKVIGDPKSDWGELRATNYIAFDSSSFIPWFERKGLLK